MIYIKKNFISCLILCFTACLVIFSSSNLLAAKNGLNLWFNNVIPSLFPFFIATELLTYTNIIPFLGRKLSKFTYSIFHVPGEGAFPILMGIISGYPVGAKIVANLRINNICTKEEAERLLAFSNNSGPLFILGTVGISLFGNSTIGILLLITHILGSLTVGFLFRFWKYSCRSSTNSYNISQNNKSLNFSDLGEVIGNSIKSATSTILLIGGFIILFSVIISILESSHIINIFSNFFGHIFNLLAIDSKFSKAISVGFLEITNGIKQLSSIPNKVISTNIILTAFLLGFGGISVLLQVASVISKTDISIFPYFIGKLLHGLISGFYTYISIKLLPFFNFDLPNYNFSYKFNILIILLIFSVGIYFLLHHLYMLFSHGIDKV